MTRESDRAAATLTPATSAALPRLFELVRAFHDVEGIDLDDAQRRAAITHLLRTPALGRIWLIEFDGRCIGYCVVCCGFSLEFGGRDGFLDEFFLCPAWRGRGIGGRMLAALPAACRALGIRALHLEVSRDNRAARRLYAAAGFRARERFVLMSRVLTADD